MSRVLERYRKEVVPTLSKQFNYRNVMQVPRLTKIVLNTGVGEATQDAKAIEHVVYAMTQISGQKPVVTKSKKAIASFKLRVGQPIGVMVTLRNRRMYDFFDRLVSVALPRVKDFRGTPRKGFDGRGSYTMGIKEQIVFPEIELDKLDKVRGLNVTFVTNARSDDEGRALLTALGLPFRK
ncbi:MAG: 50S ribosomal protein L5 [Deltaproteobacteria bacterium]|nr:50S ribosomal protein L5 [Deltaproteobacteria bacterium]